MTVQDLFLQARDRPTPDERRAFLDSACGTDPALRARIERLLAADGESHPLLDQLAVPGFDIRSLIAPSDPTATQTAVPFALPPSARPGALGRLGHYELLSVTGRGGFGVVFRAEDTTLRREVAVKVLYPQLAVHPPFRRRFVREAQAAAAVRHPNVVQVYAVADADQPYLVMEFIAGETLQQCLDREGRLPVADVVRVVRQVAAGLAAAHAAGLVHRDVKPANVLLDRSPGGRVLVSDFGLAWATDDAGLSQQGLSAGTPLYMSPEQARGDRPDHRSDLFSLGSVMFTALTGRPPFAAANSLAVLKRVTEDPPPPFTDPPPRWLADILARLLAKDPAGRFATADELVAELDRHPTDDQTETPRAAHTLRTVPQLPARPATRPTGPWLLALGGIVLAAAMWVAGTRQTDRPEQPVAPPVEPPPVVDEVREAARRDRYHTDTSLAVRIFDAPGGLARLADYVRGWEPRPGETDLRGWEWRLARHMAGPVTKSFPLPGTARVADYSPDGRTLAVGSGGLTLIDADTGERRAGWTLREPNFLRWEPAGNRLLLGQLNRVTLFDPATGTAVWERPAAEDPLPVWDTTGRRVAYQDTKTTCCVADARTGDTIQTLPSLHGTYAFRPDGARFASATRDPSDLSYCVLTVRRTTDWGVESSAQVSTESPRVVAWSPDGKQVAVGTVVGRVNLFDPATGTVTRTLDGNGCLMNALTWRADGKLLAAGDDGGHVRIWDADSWEDMWSLRGASGIVHSVRWRSGRNELAAGADGRTVRVWATDRLPPERSYRLAAKLPNAPYLSCAWHPDGLRLAGSTGQPGTILWAADGRRERLIDGVQWQWAADGSHAVSVYAERVEVRDEAGTVVARANLPGQPKMVAWHPTELVLAVRAAGRIFLWRPLTPGKPEQVIGEPNPQGRIDFLVGGGLAWSPDGQSLAFGDQPKRDGPWRVRVWDTVGRRDAVVLPDRKEVVRAVTWSPDGTRLGVVGDEPTVRLHDAVTGAEWKSLIGHGATVHTASWHPDGTRLATGSADGTVKVWDVEPGRPTITFDTGAVVRHLAWSADGNVLAAATEAGRIQIWNASEDRGQ